MKPLLTTAVALLAGLLAACGPTKQDGAAAAETAAPTKIVVGLDDNFPPMGFRDDKNELVGFDIDMAREAASRMGIEAEFKPIDWSAKESELNSKRVDLLWNGLTITPERLKNINFTTPYMENHQIIIVNANSDVKTKADLADKVVGVQDGSSAVNAIEADEATVKSMKELKKYGDNVVALLDLNTKRIQALVVDEVVGRYYVAKHPENYVILEDNFGTEDYGVGVGKHNEILLANLQKALDEMKADGTSAKIATKWFGSDIIK